MSLVAVGRCGGEVFLEPVRGFCCGWGMEWNVQNGWKGLICCENVLDGAESAAICLGRSRVRGSMLFCGCRRTFCQP